MKDGNSREIESIGKYITPFLPCMRRPVLAAVFVSLVPEPGNRELCFSSYEGMGALVDFSLIESTEKSSTNRRVELVCHKKSGK